MPAISFQSVSKTFPAKSTGAQPLKALNDVSFDIAEGEFFGLLGPNGAGKTTLISILAGLSKATQGRVLVHGHDVQTDYVHARRMLGEMSGRTHRVHTAISVVRGDRQAHTVDTASVTLVHITPELMDWYLGIGESLDKAGAYALQGDGGKLVESVQGSFHTVVGLPLEPLLDLLAQCGLSWKIGA